MTTKVLITSEIASWTINGVNKTFTTLYQISNINLIVVNGNEDAQYTYSWNTIVFDDAPTAWQVLVTYSYESNFDYLDNSWWVVWEVTSWVVDWVNKVYSVFYPISIIDEVRVDGVPTASYSIVGNSIKLTTAPTTWYVEIDYFRKDLVAIDYSRDIYYTKKEVRDMVYTEIGQDDTSVQYPKSLVDTAIADGVTELVTQVTDKSRYLPFHIINQNQVSLSVIENSNSTMTIDWDYLIPPSGRFMNYTNWHIIDYSQVTGGGIVTIKPTDVRMVTNWYYLVWYRLPRNIKRVTSVTWEDWEILQDAWSIPAFVYGWGWYRISNGYIYINSYWKVLVEVEVDEYIFWDDNSFVFVDREDIGVIVYYALRQLYQSRESDKLNSAAQIYLDKVKSYKMRMRKKRSNNALNLMKTSNWLIP